MEQEIECSAYANIQEPRRTEANSSDTQIPGVSATGRRLLGIGILTLALLCIIQAILNISLNLAFYSKEDTGQFPFNSSVIADMCQIDQSQQNSNEFCSCCNNLLRRLLKHYRALETERDLLRDKVNQLTRDKGTDSETFQGSGSGFLEDIFLE